MLPLRHSTFPRSLYNNNDNNMKTPSLLAAAIICLWLPAHGQVFIYDQQSVTGDIGYGGLFDDTQTSQPIGQSFTPALSSVGFVRLLIGNGLETASPATPYVDLLGDSITGPVLGQSQSITIPGGSSYAASFNFLFSTPVSVTPGMTYYLQPVLVGNNPNVSVNVAPYGYSGGNAFVNGASDLTDDLWFREGIVVPEPSVSWLVLLGSAVLFYVHRTHKIHRLV